MAIRAFPGTDLVRAPSAHYSVCEQDGCGGKSGYAYPMYPVPDPMYPLPISGTFHHAAIEWWQSHVVSRYDILKSVVFTNQANPRAEPIIIMNTGRAIHIRVGAQSELSL
jgi:hypothetical protein